MKRVKPKVHLNRRQTSPHRPPQYMVLMFRQVSGLMRLKMNRLPTHVVAVPVSGSDSLYSITVAGAVPDFFVKKITGFPIIPIAQDL